jgi:hypothetical protein
VESGRAVAGCESGTVPGEQVLTHSRGANADPMPAGGGGGRRLSLCRVLEESRFNWIAVTLLESDPAGSNGWKLQVLEVG